MVSRKSQKFWAVSIIRNSLSSCAFIFNQQPSASKSHEISHRHLIYEGRELKLRELYGNLSHLIGSQLGNLWLGRTWPLDFPREVATVYKFWRLGLFLVQVTAAYSNRETQAVRVVQNIFIVMEIQTYHQDFDSVQNQNLQDSDQSVYRRKDQENNNIHFSYNPPTTKSEILYTLVWFRP